MTEKEDAVRAALERAWNAAYSAIAHVGRSNSAGREREAVAGARAAFDALRAALAQPESPAVAQPAAHDVAARPDETAVVHVHIHAAQQPGGDPLYAAPPAQESGATNGVAAVETKGEADSPIAAPPQQEACIQVTAELDAALRRALRRSVRVVDDGQQEVRDEATAERWVVVRQSVLDVGEGDDVRTGGLPELGYALTPPASKGQG